MAIDAYLKIDGIPGESLDAEFKDWIELEDFNVGASQSASAVAISLRGAASGRASLSDFHIRKLVDRATPKLHEACCSGKHFAKMVICVNRAGDERVKYLEITLEDVIVSSVNLDGNGATTDGFPTQSITLNYARITMIYTQQSRANGQGGGRVLGGWDAATNKVYA
jgi:type VI secretion system secreted protein Hcp